MNAGTWIALGWLAVASGFLRWLYIRTTPEPPDDVIITFTRDDTGRRIRSNWHYIITDRDDALWSTGYLTRNSAIRAAQQELDRLAQEDAKTL